VGCNVTKFYEGVRIESGTLETSTVSENTNGVHITKEGSVTNSRIANNKYGIFLDKGAKFDPGVIDYWNNGQNIRLERKEVRGTAPSLLQQDVVLDERTFVEELAKREYSIVDVPIPTLNERITRLGNAADNIIIEREFIEAGGQTTVIVTLRPTKSFFNHIEATNVEFYEKIPKCFGLLLDVIFEQEPEIIEEDIVYKRSIAELRREIAYKYRSARIVDQNCKDLFYAVGLAESAERLSAGRVISEEGLTSFMTEFWTELWKLSLTVIAVLFALSIILRKVRPR